MATVKELEDALINADAAGDTAAAQFLADEIKRVQVTPQAQQEAPQKPSMTARLARQAGLTGRYLAEGATGAIGAFTDPVAKLVGLPGLQETTSKTLTALGVPQPETGIERVAAAGSRALAGAAVPIAAGGMATAAPAVAKVLTAAPLAQAKAAGLSGVAGQTAAELGASPAVQTAAAVGGALVGGRGPAPLSPKDEILAAGQKAGLVVQPTMGKPSAVNRFLEGLAGKITTAQQASIKNEEAVQKLARRAIGADPDTPLSADVLKALKAPKNAVYEQAAQAGTIIPDNQYFINLGKLLAKPAAMAQEIPELANKNILITGKGLAFKQLDAATAIETIKSLRFRANAAFRSEDPLVKESARFMKSAANELENLMERNLAKKAPDLMGAWRTARQELAKIHTVEEAVNPATGMVRAGDIARQLEHGAPLTGDLRTIGRFANPAAFGKAVQEVKSSMPGLSPLDFAVAGLGGATSAAFGDKEGQYFDPRWLAYLALRPAARNLILTSPYQRLMVSPGTNQFMPYPATLGGILGNASVEKKK